MFVVRMTMLSGLIVSAAVAMAQPCDYRRPCYWPSAANACQPAHPMSYPQSSVWQGYSSAAVPFQPHQSQPHQSQPHQSQPHPAAPLLQPVPVGGYHAGRSPSGGPCQSGQIVEAGDAAFFGNGLAGITSNGLFGGFEFLWMRPSFDQNVALIIDPPVGNKLVPFDYSMNLSPRAWLGIQSCSGLGFRATYFQLDDDAPTESVTAVAGATPVFLFVYGAGGNLSRNANANIGQTLVSNHSLALQSLDLEATQVFQFQRMRAMLGLGVRIGDIEQHLRGNVFNAGGTLEEAVGNDLDFSGAGPTVSAQLTRSLGQSRFNLYGSARGSMLVGTTTQRIYEMKGAFTTELEDIARQREVLGVLEFGIGLQYGQSIGRSSGMFVRAGYEAQIWMDAGGPVDSHSTIGLDGVTLAAGINF